jgi:molybdate transport system substrate-binding protein
VASGQALDVSLLFAPFPEALETGNIDPKSATVVARLRLAIGVKKGAPKPDISTTAAVRQTLLTATSIASVDPEQGSVGGAVLLALERMGITGQVRPKIEGGVRRHAELSGRFPRQTRSASRAAMSQSAAVPYTVHAGSARAGRRRARMLRAGS